MSRHYVSMCVERLSIASKTHFDLDRKNFEVRTRSFGSTVRFSCSNLFSIPDCSAQIPTRYVTFIVWL